jgi:hypothetical protein
MQQNETPKHTRDAIGYVYSSLYNLWLFMTQWSESAKSVRLDQVMTLCQRRNRTPMLSLYNLPQRFKDWR